MKKTITITIAFIFLITLPLSTQFKLGLEPTPGLNYNIYTGSDLKETGSGVGIVFGGYAHMSFSKSIGMIAGLAFYDNRSASYSETGSAGDINYTSDVSASLAYFQIESLFKYSLPTSDILFCYGTSTWF